MTVVKRITLRDITGNEYTFGEGTKNDVTEDTHTISLKLYDGTDRLVFEYAFNKRNIVFTRMEGLEQE